MHLLNPLHAGYASQCGPQCCGGKHQATASRANIHKRTSVLPLAVEGTVHKRRKVPKVVLAVGQRAIHAVATDGRPIDHVGAKLSAPSDCEAVTVQV